MTINLELWSIVGTVVATLVGKWVWDRWLSDSSRISQKTCELIRAKCQQEMLGKMGLQENRLEDGDSLFKSTRHYQRAVILTLLHICNKMGIDCDQITKVMVEQDILQ